MKNYYSILKINKESELETIRTAYNFGINQFNNLPFLTDKMKDDIKDLKTALYILENKERRDLYNKKIFNNKRFNNNKESIDNRQICDRLFSITFN